LRDPGAADAEVAGKRRPALELAGIEQRLVIASEFERVAVLLPGAFRLRFPREIRTPRKKRDDRRTS
jgi:hypothetical protein